MTRQTFFVLLSFVVLNMLIVIGSLGFILYTYTVAGSRFSRDLVYIVPRTSGLNINPDDVEHLRHAFPSYSLATEGHNKLVIFSPVQEAVANVIYVNTPYFEMLPMDFIDGWYWHGAGTNEIVLNEVLAWQLFGSLNVVGLTVWINYTPHIITGVVQQETGNAGVAWMPIRPDTPVTALYIRPSVPDILMAYRAKDILNVGASHQRGMDYSIVDINRYVESKGIRYRILLYSIWLSVFIMLLPKFWTCINDLIKPDRQKSITNAALTFTGVGLCAYILMGTNDILYWLPNLSNPYALSVFESISTIGLLPPDEQLPCALVQLNRLSRLSNYALIVGFIAYVNLLFCTLSQHTKFSQV